MIKKRRYKQEPKDWDPFKNKMPVSQVQEAGGIPEEKGYIYKDKGPDDDITPAGDSQPYNQCQVRQGSIYCCFRGKINTHHDQIPVQSDKVKTAFYQYISVPDLPEISTYRIT